MVTVLLLPERRVLGAAEEAVAALGPDAHAVGVARRCLAKLLAPALPSRSASRLGSTAWTPHISGAASFRVISIAVAVMANDTKTMAPSRASILPSMAATSVAVAEHLRVAGLIARARRQEAAALFAALFGGRRRSASVSAWPGRWRRSAR
jgi:hypothetical protein